MELERQLMFNHTSEEQLPPPTPQQPSPPASSSLNYSRPPLLSTYYRLRPTVEAVPQTEPIFINEDDKGECMLIAVPLRRIITTGHRLPNYLAAKYVRFFNDSIPCLVFSLV